MRLLPIWKNGQKKSRHKFGDCPEILSEGYAKYL